MLNHTRLAPITIAPKIFRVYNSLDSCHFLFTHISFELHATSHLKVALCMPACTYLCKCTRRGRHIHVYSVCFIGYAKVYIYMLSIAPSRAKLKALIFDMNIHCTCTHCIPFLQVVCELDTGVASITMNTTANKLAGNYML